MLAEKMERWAALKEAADKLEAEIKEEVMALGKTQKANGVTATYSNGRGSYDYESMAMKLEPDTEVVQEHSTVKVNWRAVCEATDGYEDAKEFFYKPGSPYVSVKLK
jgi:hypothetical protein